MPEGIPYSSSNVVAGTGLDLNYIGKHCYAYNNFAATTATQTVFDFVTSADYIVAIFQFNGPVDFTTPQNSENAACGVKFNGLVVASLKALQTDMPSSQIQRFVIPPYTHVTVTVDSTDNQSARIGTVSLTGELYR
jgi:alpha-galactosidase